jgi:hypothetical protein
MSGNTWGFQKIGVIHGAQSRHVLQTHKRDRAATTGCQYDTPSLHIKRQAALREGGHAVRRRQITLDKR